MMYAIIPVIVLVGIIFGANALTTIEPGEQNFGAGPKDCNEVYRKSTYNGSDTLPLNTYFDTEFDVNNPVYLVTDQSTSTPFTFEVNSKEIQTYIDKGFTQVFAETKDFTLCENGGSKTEVEITPAEAEAFKMNNQKPQK